MLSSRAGQPLSLRLGQGLIKVNGSFDILLVFSTSSGSTQHKGEWTRALVPRNTFSSALPDPDGAPGPGFPH